MFAVSKLESLATIQC